MSTKLLDGGGGFVPDDGNAGTVVFEGFEQFVGGVERVVLNDYCAEFQYCVESGDVLWAVGEDNRYVIAGADAQCAQASGSFADFFVQFTVGL